MPKKKQPKKKAQPTPTPSPETEPSPHVDRSQTPFVWHYIYGIY